MFLIQKIPGFLHELYATMFLMGHLVGWTYLRFYQVGLITFPHLEGQSSARFSLPGGSVFSKIFPTWRIIFSKIFPTWRVSLQKDFPYLEGESSENFSLPAGSVFRKLFLPGGLSYKKLSAKNVRPIYVYKYR